MENFRCDKYKHKLCRGLQLVPGREMLQGRPIFKGRDNSQGNLEQQRSPVSLWGPVHGVKK